MMRPPKSLMDTCHHAGKKVLSIQTCNIPDRNTSEFYKQVEKGQLEIAESFRQFKNPNGYFYVPFTDKRRNWIHNVRRKLLGGKGSKKVHALLQSMGLHITAEAVNIKWIH